ncbi:hypothetical protein RB195_006731 [Necator americanus]|uniref:Uncharacterized protein n=1 Tax=Necator americanus TaxID=51031 RepID=A0ABR1BU02_NECAM
MKKCFPVLNTANGVIVGEATLPVRRNRFNTFLNQQASSARELEHVQRPTYAKAFSRVQRGSIGVPAKGMRQNGVGWSHVLVSSAKNRRNGVRRVPWLHGGMANSICLFELTWEYPINSFPTTPMQIKQWNHQTSMVHFLSEVLRQVAFQNQVLMEVDVQNTDKEVTFHLKINSHNLRI